jgi:hypothetical protein
VRPERFELPSYCSGGNRSIHLSYGRIRFSLHADWAAFNVNHGELPRLGNIRADALPPCGCGGLYPQQDFISRLSQGKKLQENDQ